MTTTYEVTEGTTPTADAGHEPRTIRAVVNAQVIQMMSEIGDGQFVAWGYCGSCRNHVSVCKCGSGPVEPDFIGKWRDERFNKSMNARLNPTSTYSDERKIRLSRPIPSAPIEPAPIDEALDKALAAVAAVTQGGNSD